MESVFRFFILFLLVCSGCSIHSPKLPEPSSDVPVRSHPGFYSQQQGVEVNNLTIDVLYKPHVFHKRSKQKALVRFTIEGTVTGREGKYPTIDFVQFTTRLNESETGGPIGDIELVPFKSLQEKNGYGGEPVSFSIKVEQLVQLHQFSSKYRVTAGDQEKSFKIHVRK